MRVAVVYESLFGNTRLVAEAIAEGIQAAGPGAVVKCSPVTEAGPALAAVDLLVVGGPTHFLGMTSQRSRRMQHQYQAQAARHGGRQVREDHPVSRVCANGSTRCPRRRAGTGRRRSTPGLPAYFPAAPPASSAAACLPTATSWPPSRKGSSWRSSKARCRRVSVIAPGRGGHPWPAASTTPTGRDGRWRSAASHPVFAWARCGSFCVQSGTFCPSLRPAGG